jgi:Flp pilus assembly protein TadD
MTNIKNNSSFLTLSLVLATIGLSACGGGENKSPPETSMNPRLKSSAIDKAMERAMAQAQASGNAQEILAMLAQIHGRNPDDAIVATRYGRALREDEQINAAIRTLESFTTGPDKNIEATTEMAMAQIALGDFNAAKNYAQSAIEMNSKNSRAYLALGTAQDALSHHQDAEISFRAGLKNWKGDPTPILNNLALNLASQGHLEESLSLLEKALKISPNRMDLERNRRIIATLVETSGPRAPAPNAKPDATPDASKKVEPIEMPNEEKLSGKVDPKPKKKPSKKQVTETAEDEIKGVVEEKERVKNTGNYTAPQKSTVPKMKLNNIKSNKALSTLN